MVELRHLNFIHHQNFIHCQNVMHCQNSCVFGCVCMLWYVCVCCCCFVAMSTRIITSYNFIIFPRWKLFTQRLHNLRMSFPLLMKSIIILYKFCKFVHIAFPSRRGDNDAIFVFLVDNDLECATAVAATFFRYVYWFWMALDAGRWEKIWLVFKSNTYVQS